jgi:alpha-galactosidase
MTSLRYRIPVSLILLVMTIWSGRASAVEPTKAELADAGRWAAAKFAGVLQPPSQDSGLLVVSNHGPVQQNARGSEPLRIGPKSYQRGLYCHAPSKVIVRLPGPGKSFHAEIGVDSRAGGGSVVFLINVDGAEAFRSPVMHIDSAPKSVDVDLKGQTEFTLEITDAGDGINSDQGNWADARVTLADGSLVWPGDLPIIGATADPISTAAPFSFTYDGNLSADLLPRWKVERETKSDAASREHTLRYTDPESGLVVRCVGVEWIDSPTIEWTLYFKNGGTKDSAIIQNIRAIDSAFPRVAEESCIFRYNTGDLCTPDSYQPHADPMPAGYQKHIANTGGRPTQEAFPYFNLVRGGGPGAGGAIVALGWPGQWSADVDRNSAGGVRIRAGQELTHFRLKPNEEVRGPRVIVQFYRGDWIRGQNLWRRWMITHNMRRPGGKPMPPIESLCTGNFYPGLMSNAKQELAFLKQHVDAGFKFDIWWQDAGWYPCDGVTWPKTGTWEVDTGRFPHGLREVSDYVHANGMKSLLWFEPERVQADTWLADNHPEWIYGQKAGGGKAGGLLKLGEPACRQWLTNHIDKFMTEQGIDNYRQDFNIDPLTYWRSGESEDRQGINEIRHVEGYLAYWDELLQRHLSAFIDSCASGGRRNDVETMRRAVPLLRSDWYWAPEGQQCQTYGLAMWLPYQGTGFLYSGKDKYWIRSCMVSSLTFGPDSAGIGPIDLGLIKSMSEEHKQIADCFTGDFYPLTPYSLADDVWMAWQYDAPENGKGVVQAFRRSQSIYEVARLRLSGLNPDANYLVTDLETKKSTRHRGQELMDPGLAVNLPNRSSATAVTYRRVD